MKRAAFLIISVIGLISLAACQENKENQSGSAGHDGMETIVLELELDSDYDDTEPFVNELLFCVSQDIDVLDAESGGNILNGIPTCFSFQAQERSLARPF